MKKIILITGASGFLGTALCYYFRERGYTVRALGRIMEPHAFDDADTIIHCAWDMRHEVNVENTRALKKLSTEKNIKEFIFISSLAAHTSAHSVYGRTKLEAESTLDTDDCIIRPGTIVGNGGLFKTLRTLMHRAPFVPVFFPQAPLYTIYIDDLCQALFNAVETQKHGVFSLAYETPASVREFYTRVSELEQKQKRLITFPGNAALFCIQLCEKIGLTLPITADNLLGLKYATKHDTHESNVALGITPFSLAESIARLQEKEKAQ